METRQRRQRGVIIKKNIICNNDRHRRRVSTAINGTATRIRTSRSILTVTLTSMVEWQEGLLSAEYRLFASGDLCIFHQSREMEISLRESSRRNLVRIVQYSHRWTMPYDQTILFGYVYSLQVVQRHFHFELLSSSSSSLDLLDAGRCPLHPDRRFRNI